MQLFFKIETARYFVACNDLAYVWLRQIFRASNYLVSCGVVLVVSWVIPSSAAFASNAEAVSEIKKLYTQVNIEIQNGAFKKLYLYKIFPSQEWLVQTDYTKDVKDSGDLVVVYYRNGYVAKIRSNLVIGDGDALDESYFRKDGRAFFHFSEHYDRGIDEYENVTFSITEERHYIDKRGRLIRHLRAVYNTDKKGKKAGLDYSENEMDIDLDAKESVDISNISEFESYEKIRKLVNGGF